VGVLGLGLAWVGSGAQGQEPPASRPPVDFYSQIQPLLFIHCVGCHGPEKEKSSFRVDRPERLKMGGDSGEAAVVPGSPEQSALLRRLLSKDPDEKMPPEGPRVPAEKIDLLRRWIAEGARWPERDEYWAFQPPRPVPVPAVRNGAAVRNEIDAFLLRALEERGLGFSSPAGKGELLRRVYADLVGMPPTPAEAEAFLTDPGPDAYERLVDRLLADPRYGERWARHWLDLVRYAESNGFENDFIRPHAWRYRDYVIHSLNGDKPFDRFIREQLAGDELYPEDSEAISATGFARLGSWDDLCKNEKQRWQEYLNDATDTTGSVFLGLTLGCARCHDHKYDRVTMVDYYSMQSFFAAAQRLDLELPRPSGDSDAVRARAEEARQALGPLRARKRALLEQFQARLAALKAGVLEPEEHPSASLAELKKAIDLVRPGAREKLEREISTWEEVWNLYRPAAEAIAETGSPVPPVHVLRRGSLGSPGPEVKPAFIAALRGERSAEPSASPARGGKSTGRRSALAQWIASDRNPLTARVAANRIWQHHFGVGIVPTPSDFGRNGQPPSHPLLLDYLAGELVRHGWRLKPLHRRILLSAAYRQSSGPNSLAQTVDPENRLLWRMRRQRLEGEAIRDSILWVSGRLSLSAGGPGVYAKISKEVLIDIPNNDKIPSWGASTEEEGHRRTIYITQRRALMLPLVEAFDGADMNHTCPRRSVTTVAPQALALFNGEFTREEARHFADRVIREAGEDPERQVEGAFRRALVRPPTAEEKRASLAFLREQAGLRTLARAGSGAGADPESPGSEARRAALQDFCHVLLNTNEFLYVD
jgi:hypothetical protein